MKIEFSACSFGSDILSRHVRALRQEMYGAIVASDIEHIHQLRVCSRRIRSTLPLFSNCFSKKDSTRWLNQIKKVTKSLGEARDSDVQIEKLQKFYETIENSQFRPGLKRLILRLQQKRNGLQKNVLKSLESLTKSQMLEELEIKTESYLAQKGENFRFPLSLYHMSYKVIQDKLAILRAFDPLIYDQEKIEELHEMRIAAKNLRYTMEIFTPLYQSGLKPAINHIKEAQDILGDIHDFDVWTDLLPGFLEEERKRTVKYHGHPGPMNLLLPGINFFKEHCREERDNLYQEFIFKWDQWKNEEVWEILLGSIELPTYPVDAVTLFEKEEPIQQSKETFSADQENIIEIGSSQKISDNLETEDQE